MIGEVEEKIAELKEARNKVTSEQKQKLKEEFFALQTYEEYIKRQSEFRYMDMDKETMAYFNKKLRPTMNKEDLDEKDYKEMYTFFPDGSRMLGGCGQIAVKEKGYKSVEDYYRRIKEESNN